MTAINLDALKDWHCPFCGKRLMLLHIKSAANGNVDYHVYECPCDAKFYLRYQIWSERIRVVFDMPDDFHMDWSKHIENDSPRARFLRQR